MDMDQSFFFQFTEQENSAIKSEHPVNRKLKFRRIDKRVCLMNPASRRNKIVSEYF